jgi:Ferritin-like domain
MGARHIDTRLLKELAEQSRGLDSDAVRMTGEAPADLGGRAGPTPHPRWWQYDGPMPGMARNAPLPAGSPSTSAPASASASPSGTVSPSASAPPSAARAKAADVMALRTAASIENLVAGVYHTASGLPFVKHGNATIAAFLTATMKQHKAHAKAFNAAAVKAGGAAQHGADPKYAPVIDKVLPTLRSAADVVMLAITLEDVAAQTYTRDVGRVHDRSLRKLFASVAPVEAQHRATLLAVQSLLTSDADSLIAVPTDIDTLPASVGRVGFPDAFYPTKDASPISEGSAK